MKKGDSLFVIVFLDGFIIHVEAVCFSVAKVQAAYQRMIDGATKHTALTADEKASSDATKLEREIQLSGKSDFLLALARLMKEHKATMKYTNDDDGIHIEVAGEEVFIGWLYDDLCIEILLNKAKG